MRKVIVTVCGLLALIGMSVAASEAASTIVAPLTHQTESIVFDRFDLNGPNHMVASIKNLSDGVTPDNAIVITLDPDGKPVLGSFGFTYTFADFSSTRITVFGSNDGVNWILVTTIPIQ